VGRSTSALDVLSTLDVKAWSVILAVAIGPAALAQTADRVVAVAPQPGVLDTMLKWVGPVNANEAPHRERFQEYLWSTVGPVPIFGEAAGAGIGQWMNSPTEWGQGWGAFGKRFVSNLAYNGVRQTITYGGSVALGEDTRYFASRRSGFWPRTLHALVSTFTARHSDGRDTFSFSATAGVIGAAAASSVWGPASWKGPGNIAENAGISFGSTAVSNVVREFLPDILHRPPVR
jgi:hypothetical protein